MIKKNKLITSSQILVMGIMIGNAFFVGMGTSVLIHICKEDIWMIPFIAIIVGIIPVLLLCKIFSYKPKLNILDKNKIIFGSIIGQIINFLLFSIIFIQLVLMLWAMSDYVSTKYLTETPIIVLNILFIIPVIYAAFKGIETCSRTIQVIFFFNLFMIIIITLSLIQFVDLQNLKPFFSNGIKPFFEGSYKFILYEFSPFITLLIIPKNNILKNEKLNKNLILAYILSAFVMFIVFFFILSVLGINLITLYRYPEYYVIKKIQIGNLLDNIENFLSIHWLYNMISCAIMCMYFIKSYLKFLFKIKNKKKINITLSLLSIIIIYLSSIIFSNATEKYEFMKYKFSYYIGIPIFAFLVIAVVIIMIRNKLRKNHI